jgi:hypothetical protein
MMCYTPYTRYNLLINNTGINEKSCDQHNTNVIVEKPVFYLIIINY